MKKRLKKLIFPVCLLFLLLLVAALPTFAAEENSWSLSSGCHSALSVTDEFLCCSDPSLVFYVCYSDNFIDSFCSLSYYEPLELRLLDSKSTYYIFDSWGDDAIQGVLSFCVASGTPEEPDELEQPTEPDEPEQPTEPDEPEQPDEPDSSTLITYRFTPYGEGYVNPNAGTMNSSVVVSFGDVTIRAFDIDGNSYTYEVSNFQLYAGWFVYFMCDEYSVQFLQIQSYFMRIHPFSDAITCSVVFFTCSSSSVVVYDESTFNLVCPNFFAFDYSDVEDARQEGYQEGYEEGFQDGYASVNQTEIRHEGYVDGYSNGYVAGYDSIDQDAIWQDGFDTGIMSSSAYDKGFIDGVASIDQVGIRQEGFDAGVASIDQVAIRQEGFNAGVASIDQVGIRQEGFNAGVASIDQVGIRQEGFNAGVASINQPALRKEGYDLGYSEGKKYAQTVLSAGTFNSLITSVVDAPIKAVTGLLDFEILGQNMLSFLGALMALCLIVFILKRVI